MKKYTIKSLILMVAANCLFLTSCKKWLDVNYNPNEQTETNTTPDLILPPLLLECADINNNAMVALPAWMGYWSSAYYTATSSVLTLDNIENGYFFGSLTMQFKTPNKDIFTFEQNALKHDQPFYVGVAKVLRALSWSAAVDMYNNLPYSEAGRFDITTPRYDDGKDIYEDLIKQLDEAIELIKNTKSNQAIKISVADIMFHGDQGKWVRFINTLKLRLLMHQACRSDRESYIKAELAKITAEGSGFLKTGENADVNPGYGYSANKVSNFFSYTSRFTGTDTRIVKMSGGYGGYTGVYITANEVAMNMLKENEDPRLGFFYDTVLKKIPAGDTGRFPQPEPANYRASRLGLLLPSDIKSTGQFRYDAEDYLSGIGGSSAQINSLKPVTPTSAGIVKGYDMSAWILTSTESLFLQAEAIQRGWLGGDAESAYKDAVKESFRWLNVGRNSAIPALSDAIFNAWYDDQVIKTNPKVSWVAAPDKYKLLMFQKYLSFNGIDPFQAWVDYRRNGRFPELPLPVGAQKDKLPVRAPYPEKEYSLNAINVQAQGEIDAFNSKIWWMP